MQIGAILLVSTPRIWYRFHASNRLQTSSGYFVGHSNRTSLITSTEAISFPFGDLKYMSWTTFPFSLNTSARLWTHFHDSLKRSASSKLPDGGGGAKSVLRVEAKLGWGWKVNLDPMTLGWAAWHSWLQLPWPWVWSKPRVSGETSSARATCNPKYGG